MLNTISLFYSRSGGFTSRFPLFFYSHPQTHPTMPAPEVQIGQPSSQTHVQHNVQGSSISGRIPSLIQRQQHTLDRDQMQQQQQQQQQTSNAVDRNSVNSRQAIGAMTSQPHPPPSIHVSSQPPLGTSQQQQQTPFDMGPLNLIEQPMRRYIANNEATTEDSPQRFLQQFSKSVVGKAASPSSSRVPLGPISSAIFGNNATARGAHEITDIKEDALPEDVENLQDDIRDLRILRDTMYKPGLEGGTGKPTGSFIGISPVKPPPRGLDAANKNQDKPAQETMIRLQNGKLNTQVVYAATSSAPGFHNQQQNGSMPTRTPGSHSQTSLSATPGSIVYTEDLRTSLYSAKSNKEHNEPEVIDLDKQRTPTRSSASAGNVSAATSNAEISKKPAGGGLKWMSLNDESSSSSQPAITTNPNGIHQHHQRLHQQQQQQQQQQQEQQQRLSNISNPTYGSLSSSNTLQQQQQQLHSHNTVYSRGGTSGVMNATQDYKQMGSGTQQQHQQQFVTTGLIDNTLSSSLPSHQPQPKSFVVPKTTPSSSVIPVPLASRFNQTTHKSPLDGKSSKRT